jgi:hypothetical protein
MLANFKKVSVAAAVAAALGASGAAQAVIQGEPGDALLIPHVQTNGAGKLNTMIGVISASPQYVNVTQFPTLTAAAKTASSCNGKLHWYFFDSKSIEIVDDTIPVTCEDFVPIDFGTIIEKRGLPSALDVPGYMVITDEAAGRDGGTRASGMILYGAAYYIAGNWATQAYIPVLPLVDRADGTAGDEVEYSGSFVTEVNPVTAGMLLPNKAGQAAWFSLRYYLGDATLPGNTAFVLWFPDNSSLRASQSILVYDADERNVSARTSIPNELNIVRVSPTATGESVIRDGLAATGFVLFNVADYSTSSSVTPDGSRAGFAFSLVGVNGSNIEQIQTELAHERGIK